MMQLQLHASSYGVVAHHRLFYRFVLATCLQQLSAYWLMDLSITRSVEIWTIWTIINSDSV